MHNMYTDYVLLLILYRFPCFLVTCNKYGEKDMQNSGLSIYYKLFVL
ncbi:hypothetical protein CPTSoftv3_087 [Klebsiella phage Soft]|uniref:Uncharacterized protein n=1 Tax=Klebsiella phage Soft TaxID=2601626 RepID=A0A5C1K8F5_9CAUD|nr:hypothetical protein HWC61_gp87 [Klebsiella phage Soft]QEM42205.1 hypothetical protein CPTSoftv3_087 [Klebsiella phage Soft]